MHSAVLVIVPQDSSVAEVLAPYRDLEFDYYVVGGRFTGLLDGYDAEHDPDNFETCVLCNGTGKRIELPGPIETHKFDADLDASQWVKEMDYSRTTREHQESLGGCNGCHGKGTHLKPPSEWKPYDGDDILLANLTAEQYEGKFYAVCLGVRGWYSSERRIPWGPDEKRVQPLELPPLEWLKSNGWEGDRAVVVDCHS
ncbi:MAG: hypothetical protein ABSD96_11275 [Candidatus Korobacteraceae bacterium]|jgi:hypothetical protein